MNNLLSLPLSLIVTVATLVISTGCGGKKSEGITTNPTQRTGNSISSVDTKYVDQSPSISADGLKLVYVSGKDDSTVLRVRKATRSSGSAFSAPVKLTSTSGLTTEQVAVISPNGANVLIYGNSATGNSLVMCDFAGSTCSTVTTKPWNDLGFGFSPDSTSIYFLQGEKSSGASLFVASTAAPTINFQIGANDQWLQVLWLPQSSGLRLLAADRSSSAGKLNFKSYSFTSVSNATSSVAQTTLVDVQNGTDFGQSILGGLAGTTAVTSILASRPVKPSASLVFSELGNVTYTQDNPQKRITLRNQNINYSLSTGALSTSSIIGINTVQAYLASDGVAIFSLSQVAGRCNSEDSPTYGNILGVTNSSNSQTAWRYLKTPTDLGQAPAIADNFCDRTVGGVATSLDLSPSNFVVNGGATASAYTLAWISTMTSDPEVFVMDVSTSTTQLWNVSANRK